MLALSLLVVHPSPSWAASGGRIGGGSFRSAPSMPRSYGGGGYGGGGGYNSGYRGGYGGGGIGFPFLIPMFGFGGGGLFGFLVLMAVGGLLLNAVRGGGGGGQGPAISGSRGDLVGGGRPDAPPPAVRSGPPCGCPYSARGDRPSGTRSGAGWGRRTKRWPCCRGSRRVAGSGG